MSLKKRIVAILCLALVVCVMVAGVCFAEGDPPSVSSTLGTAFGSIASDAMGAITTILPIALPILGAVIVVVVGIKIFKKVTGR